MNFYLSCKTNTSEFWSTVIPSFLGLVGVIVSLVTYHQAKKALEENSRPYVSIYLEKSLSGGKPSYYLVIKNFGNSSCVIRNIKDKTGVIVNTIKVVYGKYELKNIVGFTLSPKQSISFPLDLKKDYEKLKYEDTFSIEYTKESGNKVYKGEFDINLKIMEKIAFPNAPITTDSKMAIENLTTAVYELINKSL